MAARWYFETITLEPGDTVGVLEYLGISEGLASVLVTVPDGRNVVEVETSDGSGLTMPVRTKAGRVFVVEETYLKNNGTGTVSLTASIASPVPKAYWG